MSGITVTKADRIDRRQFLKLTGGLLLACGFEPGGRAVFGDEAAASSISAFIRIGADESITILVGGGEMGQGIYTGLSMGAAEELMVDWQRVKVEPLAASSSWLSAGSSGISRRLGTFRTAGAAAREMLIDAAARTWGVDRGVCRAADGAVRNTETDDSLTYGQLAPLAATLPVPDAPQLTSPESFRILGKGVARPDIPSKTNGTAVYGIDAVVPNMTFAIVKHCPTIGGTLSRTPPVPRGATAIVPLDNAVAVVASNTWAAMEAAKELEVRWSIPPDAVKLDSTVFHTQAMQLLGRGDPYISESKGDVNAAFASADRVMEWVYTLPYLPHACMEVLNCTVRLTPASCEIWVPTQAPSSVLNTAAAVTGLPKASITIHPLFMGGGLGRKFEQDYVAQAIRTAQAIGQPVKLTWPREEDMARDQYRPMAVCRIRVALDAGGRIIGWANRHVSPSISAQRGRVLGARGDNNATEGATELPYEFGSRLVDYVVHPSPIPVGYWRSVGYALNAFAVESALDEVALATGADPLELRRSLLVTSGDPLAARCLTVLNAAAARGEWESPAPPGRARGIALSVAFNTIVAEVAEVSVPADGSIRVHKVACAVDCGMAVNPDSVEAQMQGGILHGLSAALWGELKWAAGRSTVRNFNRYRIARMREAPVIAVDIINSGAAMSGCGEPGVPPIAPAVANAYARLIGRRVRDLPFFPGATMGEG